MDESVKKCFLMISIVGEAKASYMKSIKEARHNDFEKAKELICQGDDMFSQIYSIQNQLTQEEVNGILNDYHQNMQDVANAHNLPFEVKAFPIGTLGEIIESKNPDCILLGPQVKYLLQDTVDRYGQNGKPITVIDSSDYGLMDGEKVLKTAIREMKKAKK